MKKLENFSKKKIIFRCDAAEKSTVGTGHLYRCILIAKFLKKKYQLKKDSIIFFCKTDKEYKNSKKILNITGFKFKKIKYEIKDNSIKEAKILSKEAGNLLVIDRISKTNLNFYKIIKNSFNKCLILEDQSVIRKKFNLSINSLVIPNTKKFKSDNLGFKYLLLQSFNTLSNIKDIKKNIFLSFGGYDHNKICIKVLKLLFNLKESFNFFIPKTYNLKILNLSKNHKVIKYSNNEYAKYYKKCHLALISGGLTLYDGVVFKKKLICIPQYNHQLINAYKIKQIYPLGILKVNDKNFKKKLKDLFHKFYDIKTYKIAKNQNTINKLNYLKTLEKISNLYEC